ncbi:MAG: hypothetical protein V3V00_08670 [Saprospiraceae bacterium]
MVISEMLFSNLMIREVLLSDKVRRGGIIAMNDIILGLSSV